MYTKNNLNGTVMFEDKVIQNIAGIAVSCCYGVVEMASVRRIRDLLFNATKKNYFEQGIVVHSAEQGVIDLDVHVILGYSIPVRSICNEIKKQVTFEIEKNLNIKVRNVMVYVESIDRIG